MFPFHYRGLVLQVRVRKASTTCVSQAEGETGSGGPDAEVDVRVHPCHVVGPGDVTKIFLKFSNAFFLDFFVFLRHTVNEDLNLQFIQDDGTLSK